MTLELKPHPAGTLLPVRALPGARHNKTGGIHDGALRIAVTAAPDQGKANTAIIRLLAKTLGIAKSRITLHSGETSRTKVFLIQGLTEQELASQLTETVD